MNNKVSVTKDKNYHNTWEVTIEDDFGVTTKKVNTNEGGRGLWVNDRQVEGTAQFSVSKIKNPSAKIRQYFSD